MRLCFAKGEEVPEQAVRELHGGRISGAQSKAAAGAMRRSVLVDTHSDTPMQP